MAEAAAPAPSLTFRPARTGDVDAVVALVQSAYRGDTSRAGWTTEADLLDGQRTDGQQVRALLERPESVVLLVEAGNLLRGCCHVEKHSAVAAYFGMFAVRPDSQGSGIGRALVREASGVAAAWGCSDLRMTVIRQRLDLIAWYRRMGFLPTGEVEPFPYGDERFGRPKRDDLEFVVLSGPLLTSGRGPGGATP